MKVIAIIVIALSFTYSLVMYLYWVSETEQKVVGLHLSGDRYEVRIERNPALYDLSEYEAKGIAVLGLVLSFFAATLSIRNLIGNRIDKDIERLEKQIKLKELNKKIDNL